MGFYSPQSLVADARRHGVEVRRPDIIWSGADAGMELLDDGVIGPTGPEACIQRQQTAAGPFVRSAPDRTLEHRRDGNFAVRLGLTEVQGLGREVAERIVAERERAAFTDLNDVVRRTGITVPQTEALATAGAFDCFGLSRRQALWNAGYADNARTLPGSAVDAAPPELPGMSAVELTQADLWSTGISPDNHPIEHLRSLLDEHGVLAIKDLGAAYAERRVRVAGLITHRQRPGTAGGVTFLNLEDETGMLNVICSPAAWKRFARVGRNANGLIIRGKIEYNEGVTNLIAESLQAISSVYPEARAVAANHRSRDFH
jgi:error-prone DNA polymerase